MTVQALHSRRSRHAHVAGPAPGLSLAQCFEAGCDHLDCHRAARAHERLSPPVPAAGTVRRLRALAWNGFSCPDLAARLDVEERAVRRLLTGPGASRGDVPAALAAAAAGLYDVLWDLYGGCPQAAEAARRRHWAPALAWDDDEPGGPWDDGHCIDDPAAIPAAGWQRRQERGWGADAERVAELADLTGMGLSLNQAAKRLRMSGAALTRVRGLVVAS